MYWKKLFASHILDRGYDYYINDSVDNLNVSPHKITADVCGTYDYSVEISLDEGKITEMYCSCPYADDGNNCKHMAAVLYEWSDLTEENNLKADTDEVDDIMFEEAITLQDFDKKSAEIKELINKTDEKTIRSFLYDVLLYDEKLMLNFYSLVNKNITKKELDFYYRKIDKTVKQYYGRDQFIDYYEAWDFISDLEDILDRDVRYMIDNNNYMEAFDLMNYIFKLVGDVDIDDSDGGTGMLASQIYDLWLELSDKVTLNEKKAMFKWFCDHLDGSVIDYLEEYIEDIIIEGFQEKEFKQLQMSFITEKIRELNNNDDSWSKGFRLGEWALKYLLILERNSADKEDIEAFCRKYWHNSQVREYYIQRCIDNKEYDKAIEVLNESIAMDKEFRGLVVNYSLKKKEVYLLQGNREAYIEELWKLILDYKPGNIEIFRELKNQYSEGWNTEREKIFSKLQGKYNLAELFAEEKLYDRLMDCVLKSSGLYDLQRYEKLLKKDYSPQILEKYKTELTKMAYYAGKRSKYRDMVAILRRMKKLSGGKKIVDQIVCDWKIRYKNRPAMMDELRKL